jgi:hypothetical protein
MLENVNANADTPLFELDQVSIPAWTLPLAIPHATRLLVTLSSSLPNSANWTFPRTAILSWPANSVDTLSWSSPIPLPPSPSSFLFQLQFECDPSGATYAQCVPYLPLYYIAPPDLQWAHSVFPVITTAFGPGGCGNKGPTDGVQDTSDGPLLWIPKHLLATDSFVLIQDYQAAAIRKFVYSTKTLSTVSGSHLNDFSLNGDGDGPTASWDWRYTSSSMLMAMVPDGSYVYAISSAGRVLRRVEVASGATTLVYGSPLQCPILYTCYWASCDPTCYPPDSSCGTDARMVVVGGIGADPQGRWVFIAGENTLEHFNLL